MLNFQLIFCSFLLYFFIKLNPSLRKLIFPPSISTQRIISASMPQGSCLVRRCINPRKDLTEDLTIGSMLPGRRLIRSCGWIRRYGPSNARDELSHPAQNARSFSSLLRLPRRVFRWSFLHKISEYDLQMLPQLWQLSYRPKDVMSTLHLLSTFTTLSRRLQRSLQYDFTDKYFVKIVVLTLYCYLADLNCWYLKPYPSSIGTRHNHCPNDASLLHTCEWEMSLHWALH